MTAGHGFLDYAWSDAACHGCLVQIAACAAAMIMLVSFFLWLDGRYAFALEELDLEERPLRTLWLSPDTLLSAYAGHAKVERHGACVAKIPGGALSAEPGGTKQDRTITVSYPEGEKVFRIGPAGWQDAVKAAGIILHYLGGVEDG